MAPGAGAGRGRAVRPNLGGSKLGGDLGSGLPSCLGFPKALVRLSTHCNVGITDLDSGSQGKLRHSNSGEAPPPKRHLIRGDL